VPDSNHQTVVSMAIRDVQLGSRPTRRFPGSPLVCLIASILLLEMGGIFSNENQNKEQDDEWGKIAKNPSKKYGS